jgi:uncharacterized SAM-binding protein YcdF (DUF218 family)
MSCDAVFTGKETDFCLVYNADCVSNALFSSKAVATLELYWKTILLVLVSSQVW